jgi:hypothetical protein
MTAENPDWLYLKPEQWIRLHVRLAAVERGGERLVYRFDFPNDDTVICNVFYADAESNALASASENDRLEIYEGWIDVGRSIIEHALVAAELPSAFEWHPVLRFILSVSYGMGAAVVHRAEVPFQWKSNPVP